MPIDTIGLNKRLDGNFFQILLVALLPVSLVCLNDEWVFTPAGDQDPWWFVGYGYQYTDPSFHPHYYKASRLPWILLEHITRRILSPAPAARALALGCLLFGNIGFFLTARRFVSAGSAFAITALLGTYTPYLVSRATDYNNTAAGPLYLWSMYLATRGICSERHASTSFFLSGMLFGLSVHSSLPVLFLTPCLVIHLLLLGGRHRNAASIRGVAAGVAGVLAVTAALAVTNWAVGRSLAFFMPQFRFLRWMSSPEGVAYREGFYANSRLVATFGVRPWFLGATHLALPIVALIASLWIVGRNIRLMGERRSTPRGVDIWALSAGLQMMIAAGIWSLQEACHGTNLLITFMSYPLIFPSFLVIACAFDRVFGEVRLHPTLLPAVVATASIGILLSPWLEHFALPRMFSAYPVLLPVILYGAGLLMYAMVPALPRAPVAVLIVVALVGLGHCFTIPQWNGFQGSAQFGLRLGHEQPRRDGHLCVVDSHLRLTRHGLDAVHLWWDENEKIMSGNASEFTMPLRDIGMSTTRTGVNGLYETEPAPAIESIPDEYLRDLGLQRAIVVVMSQHLSVAEAMMKRLRQHGEWRLLQVETITHGAIRFQLYAITADVE